ncbi:MAG: DUF3604 domain-containing protein [Deltaproteobacteria bacterium]|nr:DUF3604 domain-containing protein [Deltaproteobacteria bacterium]
MRKRKTFTVSFWASVSICLAVIYPAFNAGEPAFGFERTEDRERCECYNENRQPFFGDLHVHTSYSQDAYVLDTRNTPRDAYRFARGATLMLSESMSRPDQTRPVTLRRPLDFVAVTDHAEYFDLVQTCITPGAPGYDDPICRRFRSDEKVRSIGLRGCSRTRDRLKAMDDLTGYLENPPIKTPLCDIPGVDCAAAEALMWQDIQAAAEEAYDRTKACALTTFIAYEYSSAPDSNNLHRNVIFRNSSVHPRPVHAYDTSQDVTMLWKALQENCIEAGTGCDVLTIPHNSNFSSGLMFEDPADLDEATTRQFFEPLVEIYQHKGCSECRYDLRFNAGVGTTDELCSFEQTWMFNLKGPPPRGPELPPPEEFPPRAFVRNALKDGLVLEQQLGVNPFKYGLVGSTDGHNATPGNTDEVGWQGAMGAFDASCEQFPAGRIATPFASYSPGGLAVIWAEENSRDSLFEGLRRREAYATSGTRPVVRFFGGWDLEEDLCNSHDFVSRCYDRGVPMGGDLTNAPNPLAKPRFLVWAQKDPGTEDLPGTDLQCIQIIKGWVDRKGQTHEKVFDVAGDRNNGAHVDPETLEPVGEGFKELCIVWTDESFDPGQPSFYYARVLENPTPRWSTLQCKELGIDVFAGKWKRRFQAIKAGVYICGGCKDEKTDPALERIIQERAWTSPIWYRSPVRLVSKSVNN